MTMILADLSSLISGGGGAALGFLGGAIGLHSRREAAFNKRLDEELAELRDEVALCREERTEFAIIKMGVLMLVPEMRKQDPSNPVLVAVAAVFAQLPPEKEEFVELLKQIDAKTEKKP